ncbi:MAG: transketolase [Patescibacteria group bacterium]|nr:transketolase [Patescibacteria group bacterium]
MSPISPEKIHEFKKKANDIRKTIIEMLIEAKSGHTAGPLDMTDIFTALYFHLLKYDPKRPDWAERDRLILSNGHICPVLYATMAHAGYFPVEETLTLRKFKSRLQGHPHRDFLPALETSSGPLGSGLSQAVGMAIADRLKFFYCLTGDGELDAGQNWEAMMLAGKNKLGNLIVIVDRNKIQIDGFTEDVMPLEPLKLKWESFNFDVIEIDGHDFEQIITAVNQAKSVLDKPSVIIANTIASKGIPEFEGKFEWHGKPPSTPEEITTARNALNKIEEQLK